MTTMCIPIHGTFSRTNPWYQPKRGKLWRYLKATFPDDYFAKKNYFYWFPALASNESRWAGGEKLFQYCEEMHQERGITKFRLIAHSHGASVANICTHRMAENDECTDSDRDNVQWSIRQLVMLAPYVGRRFPSDHQPNLDVVDGKKFFNFHAKVDNVVPRHNQNHNAFPYLRKRETEVVFKKTVGHWKPTKRKMWDRYELDELLLNG